MPVIGPPITSAPPITHCDWSKTSFCATVTNLDILLISPMTLSQFVNNGEYMYDSHGCFWLENEITSNISGIGLPTPIANTNEIAQHKAIKDFYNCMAESCGCSSPISWNIYGCMDDGHMGLTDGYLNNRTTWDFYTMNNTTSTGVVRQPDGTSLPGPQWGSAYPFATHNIFGVPSNFNSLATVDDGSCDYSWSSGSHNYPAPKPYRRVGCMDNTPHNAADHGFPYGFPDINGHGTAAVYACHTASATNQTPLTVPSTPDPCGTGPGTQCVGSNNTGYLADGYDPCANFSCGRVGEDPNNPFQMAEYSSDVNWTYTHHLDGGTWASTTPWSAGPGPAPGVGGNPPGLQKWRPFGDTSCCNYKPPPNIEEGLTYDFRLSSAAAAGGCMFASHSSPILGDFMFMGWSPGAQGKIGDEYLFLIHNRSDAVGNDWGGDNSEMIFGHYHPYGTKGYKIDNPTTYMNDFQTIRIRIYDIYENLLGDYDYKFIDIWEHFGCHDRGPSGIQCQVFYPKLQLVQQNYPDPILSPNYILDVQGVGSFSVVGPYNSHSGLSPVTGVGGVFTQQRNQSYGPLNLSFTPTYDVWAYPSPYFYHGQPPNGYVRIDCKNSGKTKNPPGHTDAFPPGWLAPTPPYGMVYQSGQGHPGPARTVSSHWTGGVRGNTKNLGLDTTTLIPKHWTGKNYRAIDAPGHPHHNPYPNWGVTLHDMTVNMPQIGYPLGTPIGWEWPHGCNDCAAVFAIGTYSGCLVDPISDPNPMYDTNIYWLEPGPNDWTPMDFYYQGPISLLANPNAPPMSIHIDSGTAQNHCQGYVPFGPTITNLKLAGQCGRRDCGVFKITTSITYNKDKNQEVTITSPSTDEFTPESTQITTPPPTTPIPPPTTPPPTTPPPTTMTGSGGY